jgi:hypothetical protein
MITLKIPKRIGIYSSVEIFNLFPPDYFSLRFPLPDPFASTTRVEKKRLAHLCSKEPIFSLITSARVKRNGNFQCSILFYFITNTVASLKMPFSFNFERWGGGGGF